MTIGGLARTPPRPHQQRVRLRLGDLVQPVLIAMVERSLVAQKNAELRHMETQIGEISPRRREELGPMRHVHKLTREQLLSLKICDPAMGSGAFLVEACRFLADQVEAAWSREGVLDRLRGSTDIRSEAVSYGLLILVTPSVSFSRLA